MSFPANCIYFGKVFQLKNTSMFHYHGFQSVYKDSFHVVMSRLRSDTWILIQYTKENSSVPSQLARIALKGPVLHPILEKFPLAAECSCAPPKPSPPLHPMPSALSKARIHHWLGIIWKSCRIDFLFRYGIVIGSKLKLKRSAPSIGEFSSLIIA